MTEPLLGVEFYSMQGPEDKEEAEKQKLRKKVDKMYIQGKFKSLVDYMTNPNKDEFNDGYTIEQQKEAMRLKKKIADDQVAVTFKATTTGGGIKTLKSTINDDEDKSTSALLKKFKLEDFIEEGSPESILLTKEIEDGSGVSDYKDIEIGYKFNPQSGLF